jgi:hypothetical protein
VAQVRREAWHAADRHAGARATATFNLIDGMLFDDDPRQGVIEGRTFRHPDLRFSSSAVRLRHLERHQRGQRHRPRGAGDLLDAPLSGQSGAIRAAGGAAARRPGAGAAVSA